ncbi:hypothetical protein B566_EDAN014212, partial [Ephemera danica]
MSEKIKTDAVALNMELRKKELQNQNLIVTTVKPNEVFADAVDGTQTLDCDTTVQKQHRLLLQYSQAHLTTVRSAIRKINDSLQVNNCFIFCHNVLSKMKNNGADGSDENRIFTEKLEKEITDLKSRLLQLEFKLSSLKIEDQTYK